MDNFDQLVNGIGMMLKVLENEENGAMRGSLFIFRMRRKIKDT